MFAARSRATTLTLSVSARMEKFSAYRDPGTGLQPFLTPVPSRAPHALANLLLPFRYLLAILRTALILLLLAIYAILVRGLCLCLLPVPSLHRCISHVLTAILTRTALFFLGLFWIPVEHISRKRGGQGTKNGSAWNPQGGDIIISNWVSWIELLWLAFRFNPVFVLPVPEHGFSSPAPHLSTSIGHVPGRNIKSANTFTQNPQKKAIPIIAFRRVSLLSIISMTGHVSSCVGSEPGASLSLEQIRRHADRPIVVFPECTTSNGRGLLKFSDVFRQDIPVKGYRIFVMCIRYNSPTTFAPSVAHSIPASFLNPLPHLFRIATALKPIALRVRLLEPTESPSSRLFVTSDWISVPVEDQLAEASGALIAQLGKMKRTGLGWEDKASFLDFYRSKNK
ncbi:hypothetical protein AX17_000928 [Amanita inopinata Kibby_2008]|nr:hypothetical protein AX17_000928 [Amanita inopinata Kibby_2008]